MYGKLFSSAYEGTLRGEPHLQLVLFNMIAHADKHGEVERTVRTIADEVGLSEKDARAAITRLESPDPNSRTEAEKGRRIVRLHEHRTWGWRLVNFPKYQAIKNAENRRAAQRADAQRRRDEARKKRDASSTRRQRRQTSTESAHVDSEMVDVDTDLPSVDPLESPIGDSAAPRKAGSRPRRPITEQSGLAGDLARAWSATHRDGCPEWGKAIVGLNTLARRRDNGEAKSSHPDIKARFGCYLESVEHFYVDTEHSLGKFLQHFDHWAASGGASRFKPMRGTKVGETTP